MKPTRAVALGHALDVMERSDWLLADLMADVYNDDVPEAERVSGDEVVAVLREMKEEAQACDELTRLSEEMGLLRDVSASPLQRQYEVASRRLAQIPEAYR